MRTARRAATALIAAVMVGLSAGCLPSRDGEPDHVPVPDEVLFDAISEIPGVTGHTLVYSTNFGYTGYGGEVHVDGDADPLCVLDTTLALLRQGRSYLSVSVRQGDEFTVPEDLDPELPRVTAFDERYGSRAGDGVLRDVDPPACQD